MELNFKAVLPRESSPRANAANAFFKSNPSPIEVVNYFTEKFPDEFHEIEDLHVWNETMMNLHAILREHGRKLPNFQNLNPERFSDQDVDITIKVLKFLSKLMKAGADKHYYLDFSEIEWLTQCLDVEVATAAFELAYNIGVPSASFAANVSDDRIDFLEVPSSLAEKAAFIFKNIEMDLGIFHYLKPDQTASFQQSFEIKAQNNQMFVVDISQDLDLQSLANQYQLNHTELWKIYLKYKVLKSHNQSISSRFQLLRLRLLSFFIVVHSRLEVEQVLDELKGSTIFMTDLVQLCDISSEYYISLGHPLDLAHLALENVLSLLESKFRIRSVSSPKYNIFQLLDLDQHPQSNRVSTSSDKWISIVTAACSIGGVLLEEESSQSSANEGVKELDWCLTARFARLGLELYALAMNNREPHHVVIDMPLIAMIVSVLASCIPTTQRIIASLVAKQSPTGKDIQTMLFIAKTLYCLELTIDKPGYLDAFRESEGRKQAIAIMHLFANYSADELAHLINDPSSRSILESALSIIFLIIQKERQSALVLHNATGDSSVSVGQDVLFHQLANNIIGSVSSKGDVVWSQLVGIIRQMIDYEPAYLSQFLTYECSKTLNRVLKSGLVFSNQNETSSAIDYEKVLIPVARLALSACLTTAGREYVESCQIIKFIVEILISPNCMLPNSSGIQQERISKIGRIICQVLGENDLLKPQIRDVITSKLTKLTHDATQIWINMTLDSGVELDSDRHQTLQALGNLCMFVEDLFSEHRRQNAELIREILQPNLQSLFQAYKCTFPPCNQMLAQLSARAGSNYPSLGQVVTAKAISSLLKMAIGVPASQTTPIVFSEIESTLTSISLHKQALQDAVEIGAENMKSFTFKEVSTVESSSSPTKSISISSSRRRSRGSSYGAAPSGIVVYVLGVLDCFPHKCITDPDCIDAILSNSDYKNHVWRFLHGTLHLDWLCMMLSHTLRAAISSSRTTIGITAITTERAILQKLFAFYRSSKLEVARFVSSKYASKPCTDCKISKNALDQLGIDAADDYPENKIPRSVGTYHLRVFGQGGALIREGTEINTSRVVFALEVGTEVDATERIVSAENVIRYKTPHGWISEHRRDQKCSPIVELLSFSPPAMAKAGDDQSATTEKPESDISQLLSLREATCACLNRVQASMRQACVYLARMIYNESSGYRSSTTMTNIANLAAQVATWVKRFFETADLSSEGTSETIFQRALDAMESSSSAQVGGSNIDNAALALYLGSVIKQVLIPILEDKNGNFNALLLRSFSTEGVFKAVSEGFRFLTTVLHRELKTAIENNHSRDEPPMLSRAGRCAAQALPIAITFVRKLSNKDVFSKSMANVQNRVDTFGHFNEQDLLVQIMKTIGDAFVPDLELGRIPQLPAEIQFDWLQALSEIMNNLSSLHTTLKETARVSSENRASDTSSQSLPRSMFSFNRTNSRQTANEILTPPPPPTAFTPDETIVQSLEMMGFTRALIIGTMNRLRTNDEGIILESCLREASDSPFVFSESTSTPAVTGDGSAANVSNTSNVSEGVASEGDNNNQTNNDAGTESSIPAISDLALPVPPQPSGNTETTSSIFANLTWENMAQLDNANDYARRLAALGATLAATSTQHLDTRARSPQPFPSAQTLRRATTQLSASKTNSPLPAQEKTTSTAEEKAQSQLELISGFIDRISTSLVNYALDVCYHFQEIKSYSGKKIDYLLNQLCDTIQRAVVAKFPVQTLGLVNSLEHFIVNSVSGVTSISDLTDIHAHAFVLTLFHNDSRTSNDIRSKVTSQFIALGKAISEGVEFILKEQNALESWPSWLPTALLLIQDLRSKACSTSDYCKKFLQEITSVESKSDSTPTVSEEHSSFTSINQTSEILGDVTLRLIDAFVKSDKEFDQNYVIAIMYLLAGLLENQSYATKFIQQHGLQTLLQILTKMKLVSNSDSKPEIAAKLNKFRQLIGRCLETSLQLKHNIFLGIRELFRNSPLETESSSEGKSVPLSTFLETVAKFLIRSPEELTVVCHDIVFFQRATTDSNSSNVQIKVQLRADADQRFLESVQRNQSNHEFRAPKTLKILHDFILTTIEERKVKEDNHKDTTSHLALIECLEAISDALLSLKRVQLLWSKVIASHETGSCKLLDTLLEYHITGCAYEKQQIDATLLMWSTSRLMVVMSAYKGNCRVLVLKAVLRRFDQLKNRFEMSNGSDELSKVQNIILLEKFCSMLRHIVQSSVHNPTVQKSQSTPGANDQQKKHGVSVDTIHYLIKKGNIFSCLSNLLFLLPFETAEGTRVLTKALELIELISKPKLLEHFDKNEEEHTNEQQLVGNNNTMEGFIAGEEVEQILQHTVDTPLVTTDSMHTPTVTQANEEEENEEDDEEEDEDEENDEDEEEDEEEVDDEDEDDDDDDDDEDDEEDEDDGDDNDNDEHGRRDLNTHIILDDSTLITDDSYVHIEPYFKSNLLRNLESDLQNDRLFNLPMNSYITPPNQHSLNSLHDLVNGLNESNHNNDTIDILVEIARRMRGGNASLLRRGPAELLGATANSNGSNQQTLNDVLPFGLHSALEVSYQTEQHPLLEAAAERPGHNSIRVVGAVINRPGQPAQQLSFQHHGINLFSTASQYNFPDELNSILDAQGDDDMIAMPAVWPRFMNESSLLQPSNQTVPRVGTINDSLAERAGLLQSLQQQFQEYISQSLERTENELRATAEDTVIPTTISTQDEVSVVAPTEPSEVVPGNDVGTAGGNEEASQSSATFTTRGNPADGFSYSATSLQALPYPNPRANLEEESVRGGPIPPLIEFEPREYEGNEEMSVLTLPQEEQSIAQHMFNEELLRVRREEGLRPDSAISELMTHGTVSPSERRFPRRRQQQHSLQVAQHEAVDDEDDNEEEEEEDDVMHNSSNGEDGVSVGGISGLSIAGMTLSTDHHNLLHEQDTYTVNSQLEQASTAMISELAGGEDDDRSSDGEDDSDDELGDDTEEQAIEGTNLTSDLQEMDEMEQRDSDEEALLAALALSQNLDHPLLLSSQNAEDNVQTEVTVEIGETTAENNQVVDVPSSTAEELNINSQDNAETGLRCPAGYDPEVFNSLPPELQQEILSQYGETAQQMRELAEAAGFDYETIASLPDNIRQEVLEQARRERNAAAAATSTTTAAASETAAAPQEIDNATFLASLPLELRAEVLLTAEAEFLQSLPPEIIAEAQVLRERAATNWQRREIMNQAARDTGAAIPAVHYDAGDDEEEEDEEEGEEEDEEEHALAGGAEVYMPNRSGRRRIGRDDETHREIVPRKKHGWMMISKDKTYGVKIPTDLLVVLAKGLLIPSKQSNEFNSLVLRVSHNICITFQSQDQFCKLLVGMFARQSDLQRNALLKLLGRHSAALVETAMSSSEADHISQRILQILISLCAGNASFTYLLLNTRNEEHDQAVDVSNISSTATASTADAADGTDNQLEAERVVLARRQRELTSEQEYSTNSLLEVLMSKFPELNCTARFGDLESLLMLMNQVTEPLESLEEIVDDISVLDKALVRPQETESIRAVRVPIVRMGRESLSQLCDLLLMDSCSSKILNLVTSSIARLSKVRSNSSMLLDVLNELIAEISTVTSTKLKVIAAHMQQIVNSQAKQELKTIVEDEQHENTTRVIVSTAAKIISASRTLLLSMGDLGYKQYEILLRLIQTLQFIAEKNNKPVNDLLPAENLAEVFQELDLMLSSMKIFIHDDESVNQQGAKSSTSDQTFLASTLRRILPAIESFFIVQTSELFHEQKETKPTATNTTTTATTTTTTTAVSSNENQQNKAEDTAKSDNNNADNNGAIALAISKVLANAPGHRYRNTPEYRRANISLCAESTLEEKQALVRVRSLRKQSSFNSVPSNLSIPRVHSSMVSSKHQRVLSFIQTNKAVLNLLVKSKPALLEENLASLVRVVQLRPYLSFENKRKYFFNQLKKLQQRYSHFGRRVCHLQIRRNQVFEDSFHQLRSRTAEELRGRLQINFYGEEGIDAGGLTREWFMILSREIFNPNYALFMAAADGATFQPNPLSVINTNHLDYFKFVGRVIGKAICDGQLMDAHFTRSFYKHVLGMPTDLTDIEATEPDYYKSLKMMLEHPLEALGMTGMTFTAEVQKFGRVEDVDLIPNGSQIVVTDENKLDYIRLTAHHRMTSAINAQIDSFLAGFYELVPPQLVSIFSPAELELLICGLPDIHIEELRQFTEYHQYHATDQMIVWFWEVLRGFNREERAAFLQFVTGTSKVPLGGFGNLQGMRGTQRFTIHKAYGGDVGTLPSAHTCYNQLDLPVYQSAEELREKLLLAIKEGSEGFGFA